MKTYLNCVYHLGFQFLMNTLLLVFITSMAVVLLVQTLVSVSSILVLVVSTYACSTIFFYYNNFIINLGVQLRFVVSGDVSLF